MFERGRGPVSITPLGYIILFVGLLAFAWFIAA